MLINKLSSLLSNKKFLFILFISFIFLSVTFYVYIRHIKPRINPTFIENREFLEKNKENYNKAMLYFFYAEWCPHSKKALPVLKSFEKDNIRMEGVDIIYKYINEEDDSAEIAMFEEKYKKKIDGYPTIILLYKDQVIEFDTEINIKNLLDFLHTVI
tara:strand:- start:1801 stop:2271 length:471 start_codon:yes stop_codon:yes gene_type:complete